MTYPIWPPVPGVGLRSSATPARAAAHALQRAAASRPVRVPSRAARWRTLRRYWQIVPLAAVLWALDAVDKFRGGAQVAGLAHAPVINQASDALGGAIAKVMNQWTSSHPLAAAPATAYYIVLHVLVAGTVGVLLLRSGHPSYPRHRNALIATGVTGLVTFWAYPVAPPRMLPGYHDTAAATMPLFHSLLETHAADQFASLPSLHVTWALWVAVATRPLLRRRLWRTAIWAYPLLTTVDVLATANHYLLDAVTAPLVLAIGYATAAALPVLTRHTHSPRRATGAHPPTGLQHALPEDAVHSPEPDPLLPRRPDPRRHLSARGPAAKDSTGQVHLRVTPHVALPHNVPSRTSPEEVRSRRR